MAAAARHLAQAERDFVKTLGVGRQDGVARRADQLQRVAPAALLPSMTMPTSEPFRLAGMEAKLRFEQTPESAARDCVSWLSCIEMPLMRIVIDVNW